MLPKRERLSRKDFSHFFSVGRRVHTTWCMLVVAPCNTLHVSVVVPKKVVQGAVARNKLRRRIYDIVRRYRHEKTLTGVYIIVVKQLAIPMEYSTLQEAVQKILANPKLIT